MTYCMLSTFKKHNCDLVLSANWNQYQHFQKHNYNAENIIINV